MTICQRIITDITSDDGEEIDIGAAAYLSFSQNCIVKAEAT